MQKKMNAQHHLQRQELVDPFRVRSCAGESQCSSLVIHGKLLCTAISWISFFDQIALVAVADDKLIDA